MDTQRAYPPETGELGLQEAIQADLSRLRGYNMRFAERLDAMAEKEARPERLSQLNNASVKAARAVRQIAVLQLEIAGGRPLANSRAPATQNKSSNEFLDSVRPKHGPRPRDRAWEHGDYIEYDDYTDEERWRCIEAKVENRIDRLNEAMDEDLRAAGRDDVCGESLNTKFKLILSIPHPAFNEALRGIEPALIYHFLGSDNLLPPALAPGVPDAWAEYDTRQKLYGGPDRRDSS
jgi:hypothetical protein